jgi:hypothetical protein
MTVTSETWSPTRDGRRGRKRLRAILLAGLTAAGLSAVAILPAVASASTHGFHVYDYSRWPIQLTGYNGSFSGGHPEVGQVITPGNGYHDFEVTYYFGQNTYGNAQYHVLSNEQNVNITPQFEVGGTNTVNAGCSIDSPSFGVCTPNPLTKGQSSVYYEDPPGTVVNLPASDAQAQANVLAQQCVNGNASSCQFTVTGETKFDSPLHQVGLALDNNTSEEQNTTISRSDTVSSSNSVEVGTEVGRKIADLVSVKISAQYSHTWEQSHTFEQSVSVNCAAYSRCWVSAVQPMFRDTGNFTLTLGNTTWNLPGVYFDSPDPNGNGTYRVDEKPLTASEKATLPKGLTSPLGSDKSEFRMPARSSIVKPKLHLALSGPKTVSAGSQVIFRVRLTRSRPGRQASYTVQHVNLHSTRGTTIGSSHVQSLSPGRTRTLRLRLRIPRSAHGQVCFAISAHAAHTRGATVRRCVRVAAL